MARARVTVLVPNPKEGFYLPALEAMALGTIVVCPDCVGNRSFCVAGRQLLPARLRGGRDRRGRREALAGEASPSCDG